MLAQLHRYLSFHSLAWVYSEFLSKGFYFQVRAVFRTYAENLEKIAHLMQPDLQRLLDKESQVKYVVIPINYNRIFIINAKVHFIYYHTSFILISFYPV